MLHFAAQNRDLSHSFQNTLQRPFLWKIERKVKENISTHFDESFLPPFFYKHPSYLRLNIMQWDFISALRIQLASTTFRSLCTPFIRYDECFFANHMKFIQNILKETSLWLLIYPLKSALWKNFIWKRKKRAPRNMMELLAEKSKSM